jgi:hypothetical protein
MPRVFSAAAALVLALSLAADCAEDMQKTPIKFETRHLVYEISPNGRNVRFADRKTGSDRLSDAPSWCASVWKNGTEYGASSASFSGGILKLAFGETGAAAEVQVTQKPEYLILEVRSFTGEGIEKLSLANITLDSAAKGERDPFAGCALARNVRTNVPELPGANKLLRGLAYPRFGFEGTGIAIIGCPAEKLRGVMQQAVTDAPELPHSSIGGPWALDSDANRESYLFNFGNLTLETAPEWIALAKKLGITQIDFHGGSSHRFGDLRPHPGWYPEGRKSLKAVVDMLHAAGIKAGLHTYAFFLAKDCEWVSPVPDPRLGKDAVFTLSADIAADAAVVPTDESTEKMSTITGFFVHNSVTVQIDDELIVYTGVSKTAPYGFTGCQRGAWGTKAAAHAKGAKVGHLKECFGLFTPDGDSTLLEEVAARTAEVFNECGFDMIYLDALDGEGILGGHENAWHYGSKFVFEIWKHLERPALQEMSTFHHHLWFVRSRMGAWDHPSRSHKKFIDIHCRSNEANSRMFLPGQLGWWAMKPAASSQTERTFSDDIEYLCCKAIGTDCGIAMMGVDPDTIKANDALARLGEVIGRCEDVRLSGELSDSIKAKLREPGSDFTVRRAASGKPEVRPVDYAKHKAVCGKNGKASWTVRNRFAAQEPAIRVEALWSADAYDAPENVTLTDFSDLSRFDRVSASSGVTAALERSDEDGAGNGLLRASAPRVEGGGEAAFSPIEHGQRSTGEGPAWCERGITMDPSINLGDRQALGVWMRGDGSGATLNLQVRSPIHLSTGIADHYIHLDFTGWRYFELIEPEGERSESCQWPYSSNVYAMFRELVHYDQVGYFGLWLGNIPAGREVTALMGPVRALTVRGNTLRNPRVTIAGRAIEFPCEIESGGYVEFRSMTDCKLFAQSGAFVRDVTPRGVPPTLARGVNEIGFSCQGKAGLSARANVTVISQGEPLR